MIPARLLLPPTLEGFSHFVGHLTSFPNGLSKDVSPACLENLFRKEEAEGGGDIHSILEIDSVRRLDGFHLSELFLYVGYRPTQTIDQPTQL